MLSGLILSVALLAPSAAPEAGPVVPAQVAQPTGQPDPMPVPQPTETVAAPIAERPSLADEHLGPPEALWAEVDYLMYWLRPSPVPLPLVADGTGGQVQPVIGGRDVEYGRTNGMSVGAGVWCNDRHTVGFGARGFMTEHRSVFAAVNSSPTGTPLLIRPFTEALLAAPAQLFISDPGRLVGGAFASFGAQLGGIDLYGIRNLYYCRGNRVDLTAGGRYLDLDEFLEVTQVSRPINGGEVVLAVPGGIRRFGVADGAPALTISDRFRTRNQFYGGSIGLKGEYHSGPAYLTLRGSVALGNNHQTIDVDGRSSVAVPGIAAVPGGLFALQNANLGRLSVDRFAVVTEVGATVGIQVTRRVRLHAGYDFLFLNNAARPGLQIDPVVNLRLVPTSTTFGTASGLTSPLPTGGRDDFYAHGLRLGAEIGF